MTHGKHETSALFKAVLLTAIVSAASSAAIVLVVTRGSARPARPTSNASARVAASATPDIDNVLRRVRSLEAKQRISELAGQQKEVPADPPPTAPPKARKQVPPLAELIQSVWTSERRDDAWARPIEAKFTEKAKASAHPMSIQRLECGAARCAVALTATSDMDLGEVATWFGDGHAFFEYNRPRTASITKPCLRDGYDIDGYPK
jgi:hypothetical protein